MTILEIMLTILCAYLWFGGGWITWASGLYVGKYSIERKELKIVCLLLWPFALLIVVLSKCNK